MLQRVQGGRLQKAIEAAGKALEKAHKDVGRLVKRTTDDVDRYVDKRIEDVNKTVGTLQDAIRCVLNTGKLACDKEPSDESGEENNDNPGDDDTKLRVLPPTREQISRIEALAREAKDELVAEMMGMEEEDKRDQAKHHVRRSVPVWDTR